MTESYHFKLSHMNEYVHELSIMESYSKMMVIHHIKPTETDDCNGITWPENMKYNQSLIIGCGDVDQQPSHHVNQSWTMYDLWNYYKMTNESIELNSKDWSIILDKNGNYLYEPKLSFLYGYKNTKHYRENKILEKWKVYSISDCETELLIYQERFRRELVLFAICLILMLFLHFKSLRSSCISGRL